MPEYLRLIIMLGEIVGFMFFSMFFVNKCDKKRRMDKEYTKRCLTYYRRSLSRYFIPAQDFGIFIEDYLKKHKRINIKYYKVNTFIIFMIFLFSHYNLSFLSYSKLIDLSVIIGASILVSIGYYMLGAELYRKYTYKDFVGILIIVLSILSVDVYYVVAYGGYLIEQNETVDIIYPEYVGETKIGYFYRNDKYTYAFKNSEGKWEYENDLKIYPKNLKKTAGRTYLEKHKVTKVLLTIENFDIPDDRIIAREVYYVLYLNEKQLMEIKTD